MIGCDETGARLTTGALGTRMGWEWVLVSDGAVLHRIRTSRGRDVIAEVLGDHRPRCWVSDRWGAQQGHADAHQVSASPTSCATSSTRSRPASHTSRRPCAACCAGRWPSAGAARA